MCGWTSRCCCFYFNRDSNWNMKYIFIDISEISVVVMEIWNWIASWQQSASCCVRAPWQILWKFHSSWWIHDCWFPDAIRCRCCESFSHSTSVNCLFFLLLIPTLSCHVGSFCCLLTPSPITAALFKLVYPLENVVHLVSRSHHGGHQVALACPS